MSLPRPLLTCSRRPRQVRRPQGKAARSMSLPRPLLTCSRRPGQVWRPPGQDPRDPAPPQPQRDRQREASQAAPDAQHRHAAARLHAHHQAGCYDAGACVPLGMLITAPSLPLFPPLPAGSKHDQYKYTSLPSRFRSFPFVKPVPWW